MPSILNFFFRNYMSSFGFFDIRLKPETISMPHREKQDYPFTQSTQ